MFAHVPRTKEIFATQKGRYAVRKEMPGSAPRSANKEDSHFAVGGPEDPDIALRFKHFRLCDETIYQKSRLAHMGFIILSFGIGQRRSYHFNMRQQLVFVEAST